MPHQKMDGKQRGQLKRMRRARVGRTLPRSGGGIHEDKKCKKLERQIVKELDEEIDNWEVRQAEEFDEAMEAVSGDVDDDEFWDKWHHFDYDDGELEYYDEIRGDLKSKDKEKKDASAD